MEVREVPPQKVEKWMSPEIQDLRSQAPNYLVGLIEDGRLENITDLRDLESSQVSVLGRGELSACYFLTNNEIPVVIKFRHVGVDAEVEALQAWSRQGTRVPEIKFSGIVPGTQEQKEPVKYMVQEAIVDESGNPAKTGYQFIEGDVERAGQVGSLMGKILVSMHKAETDKPFGYFSDMWGKGHTNSNFGEYLVGNIEHNKSFLQKQGVSSDQINSLVEKIRTISFPEKGVYVHGDFGLHNVLIENEDPLQIVVFDPNPMIADPYWDVAHQINRMEVKKIKSEDNPRNEQYREEFERERRFAKELIKSYKEQTEVEFDEQRMAVNRFMQVASKLRYETRREEVTSGRESSLLDQIKSRISSREKNQRSFEMQYYKKMLFSLLGSLI